VHMYIPGGFNSPSCTDHDVPVHHRLFRVMQNPELRSKLVKSSINNFVFFCKIGDFDKGVEIICIHVICHKNPSRA